eukprot:scaffold1848_cov111-Cylindrotheca_fusiformis.AAC.2
MATTVSPSPTLPSQYLAYKQRTEEAAALQAAANKAGSVNNGGFFSGRGLGFTTASPPPASSFSSSEASDIAFVGSMPTGDIPSSSLSNNGSVGSVENKNRFWSRFSNTTDPSEPIVCAELPSASSAAQQQQQTTDKKKMTDFDRLKSLAEQSVRKPDVPDVEIFIQQEDEQPIFYAPPPPRSMTSMSSEGSSRMMDSSSTETGGIGPIRFASFFAKFARKPETKQEIDIAKLLRKRDEAVGIVRDDEYDEEAQASPDLLVRDNTFESQVDDLERELGLTSTTTKSASSETTVPATPQLRMDGFDDVHDEYDEEDFHADGDGNNRNTIIQPDSTSAYLEKIRNVMPNKMPTIPWIGAKKPPTTKLSGGL